MPPKKLKKTKSTKLKNAVNQKILEQDVETKIANTNKQTKAAKKYQLAADEFEETFGLLDVAGKEEEYEEMEKKKKPVEPPTTPRGMNTTKTSNIGKKGKGAYGMSRKNLRAVRAIQGKSSKRNKGLSRADEAKIRGCVALGKKVDKKKGPPMYPNHDCNQCCDRKLKGGQNWSICKNRCDSNYPQNNTSGNPMLRNRIRKKLQEDKYEEDAYEFGEEDEYEEMAKKKGGKKKKKTINRAKIWKKHGKSLTVPNFKF